MFWQMAFKPPQHDRRTLDGDQEPAYQKLDLNRRKAGQGQQGGCDGPAALWKMQDGGYRRRGVSDMI